MGCRNWVVSDVKVMIFSEQMPRVDRLSSKHAFEGVKDIESHPGASLFVIKPCYQQFVKSRQTN